MPRNHFWRGWRRRSLARRTHPPPNRSPAAEL